MARAARFASRDKGLKSIPIKCDLVWRCRPSRTRRYNLKIDIRVWHRQTSVTRVATCYVAPNNKCRTRVAGLCLRAEDLHRQTGQVALRATRRGACNASQDPGSTAVNYFELLILGERKAGSI